MTTNKELIERLRSVAGFDHLPRTDLAVLAADALEASEARAKELEAQVKELKCEQVFRISEMQELVEAQARIAELEAKVAAVPDAATGRFECDRNCSGMGEPVEDCSAHGRTPRDLWECVDKVVAERDNARTDHDHARAERDAALEAIEQVRVIHRETGAGGDCAVCNEWGWPCPTVAALDGAPELVESEGEAA